MQQCSNCGESVDEDDTFCPACGAMFESAAADSGDSSSAAEAPSDAAAADETASGDWTTTHYAGILLGLAAAAGLLALATMDAFQHFEAGVVEWLFVLLWFGAAAGVLFRDSRSIGFAAAVFAAGGVVSGLSFVQQLLWEVDSELAASLFGSGVPAVDPVMGLHHLLLGLLWSPAGGMDAVSSVLLDVETITHLLGVLLCFVLAKTLWTNRSGLSKQAGR